MIRPEDFKRNVWSWAEKIGVNAREIHLRRMKRKWASCSSKGRLTFDTAILGEPEKKRMEIILNELLHLKYPNHGRMFKTLLNTYLEKWKQKGMGTDASRLG